MIKRLLSTLALLLLLSACSALTQSEIETKRGDLNAMADKAIAELVKSDPSIQDELDRSVGYVVADMKLTKVPIVGVGGGNGVLVDRTIDEHTYYTISRFDIGGGWGVRAYKALFIINSEEILEKVKSGQWKFEAGAEVSAGTAAVEGGSGVINKDVITHLLAEGGASATVTARVVHADVDEELTEGH